MTLNKNFSIESLLQMIKTTFPNALVLDGFDECIIGVTINMPNKTNVVYSRLLILNQLIQKGYSIYSAIEQYENTISKVNADVSICPHFLEEYKYDINYN